MRRSVLAMAILAAVIGTSAPAGAAEPTVTLSPRSGAAGTTVHFEGDGFTDRSWRQVGDQPLVLLERETAACDYILTPVDARASVDGVGHLSGSFTVPSEATCSQSDGSVRQAPAGTYRLAVRCVACTVGEFELAAQHSGSSASRWWMAGAALAVALAAAAIVWRRRDARGQLGPGRNEGAPIKMTPHAGTGDESSTDL